MACMLGCSGSHSAVTSDAADATRDAGDAATDASLVPAFSLFVSGENDSVDINTPWIEEFPISSGGAYGSASEVSFVATNLGAARTLAADPSGSLLYAGFAPLRTWSNEVGGVADVLVGGDGQTSPVSELGLVNVVDVKLSHGQLYALSDGADPVIMRAAIDGSGTLSNPTTVSAPAGATSIALADDFAYVRSCGAIAGYSVGSDGTLAPIATGSASISGYSAVTDESYLYVATNSDISSYAIGSDGALLSISTVAAAYPSALAISSDHTRLYATCAATTLTFALDGSGGLAMIGSAGAGGNAIWLAS
jgi:hypothetical protein